MENKALKIDFAKSDGPVKPPTGRSGTRPTTGPTTATRCGWARGNSSANCTKSCRIVDAKHTDAEIAFPSTLPPNSFMLVELA